MKQKITKKKAKNTKNGKNYKKWQKLQKVAKIKIVDKKHICKNFKNESFSYRNGHLQF